MMIHKGIPIDNRAGVVVSVATICRLQISK